MVSFGDLGLEGILSLTGGGIAFSITALIVSLVTGYILFRIVYTMLLHLTKHTRVTLDELLVRKSHKPVLLLIIVFSVFIATAKFHAYEFYGFTLSAAYTVVFMSIGIYWVVHLSNTIIDWYTAEIAPKTKTKFDDKFAPSIKKYLAFAIIVLGLLLMLTTLGVEITPLIAGLGIGGLAVALALQDTLKNFISGVQVVSDRVLEPGDWVKIGEVEGKVQEIGWRSTRIVTWDNNLYIMPNSKVVESVVLNYDRPSSKTTVVIRFQTVYGVDLNKIKEIVRKAALTVLSKDPLYEKDSLLVRVSEFKDSGIEFVLFFKYKNRAKRFNTIENIKIAVYEIFKKKKIEIPYPTYTVHIEK